MSTDAEPVSYNPFLHQEVLTMLIALVLEIKKRHTDFDARLLAAAERVIAEAES